MFKSIVTTLAMTGAAASVIMGAAGGAEAQASVESELSPMVEAVLFADWALSDGPPESISDYQTVRSLCDAPLLDRSMEGQAINNDALIAAEPQTRDAMGEYAFIKDGEHIIRMRKGRFSPRVERLSVLGVETAQSAVAITYEIIGQWEDGAWTDIPIPTDRTARAAGVNRLRIDLIDTGQGVIYANMLDPYFPALVQQGQGMDTVPVRCGDLAAELEQLGNGG